MCWGGSACVCGIVVSGWPLLLGLIVGLLNVFVDVLLQLFRDGFIDVWFDLVVLVHCKKLPIANWFVWWCDVVVEHAFVVEAEALVCCRSMWL